MSAAKIPKNRLLELRERSRLTMEEVAKLLDVDMSLVSTHENHKRPISEDMAVAYGKLYKVPTHQLFVKLPSKRAKRTVTV